MCVSLSPCSALMTQASEELSPSSAVSRIRDRGDGKRSRDDEKLKEQVSLEEKTERNRTALD